jgi:hypothetical protein
MDQLTPLLLTARSFTEVDILGRKPITNPYAFTQTKFDGEEL